ncbi:lytic transglycosylase domain-containing protein [Ralstonia sp. UBA689]|uniref:lytic transglycosylase domain-containing protein n=1 Tax=Ralstonia sp. UBA689 TaxID=1947373 RepID=UPI0025E31786|nr:lytic transglycosylase domain-containing protein [Ralstonia sp. UBA689]
MRRLLSTRPIAAALCAGALLAGAQAAWAGAQKEEYLADSVRSALSAAVADSRPLRPVFANNAEQLGYLRWLAEMSVRMSAKIPQASVRVELIETAYYEAKRAGLDPALVLGLMQVESGFRKYAMSSAGAMGLMQVMPFWTRSIGDNDKRKLFHLQSNLRYGCTILRHYLDMEGGNLYLALGRYNGSRGQPQYPNAVLAAWKRWQYQESSAMTTVSAPAPVPLEPAPRAKALPEVPARNPFSPLRIAGGS